MIDDKTRAAVMRELADEIDDHSMLTATNLRKRAAELDPPKPKPGAVVWYREGKQVDRYLGVVHHEGLGVFTPWGLLEWHEIEWRLARIPTPTQVVVDVPHPSEWPEDVKRMAWTFSQYVADDLSTIITRAEAETMHNET